MRPSIEDYETRNRQELMSVVNPIRASFEDVDKQIQTMRKWLIASGLLTFLALAISGYVLISQVRSGNPLIFPSNNIIDRR